MAARFDLKETASGKFVFNLKAGNGQIVLTSQSYSSKAAARNGIASVQKNAPDDGRFERRTSSGGAPYFVLKAANHQVIGSSQMYRSAAAMENGVASVRKNAPAAATVDLTELEE